MANKKFTIEIDAIDNLPDSLSNLRALKKELKGLEAYIYSKVK